MGLDGEADSQAKNARRHKPVLEEAPRGYHAEAHNNARGIAAAEDDFRVGNQDTNEKEGNAWRIASSKIPSQKSGEGKERGEQNHPKRMRGPIRQKREREQEDKCGGQIDIQGHRLVDSV
jgi:hypothetical protein